MQIYLRMWHIFCTFAGKFSRVNNFQQSSIMDAITICTIIGTAISLIGLLGGIIGFSVKIGQFTEKFKHTETSYSNLESEVRKLSDKIIKIESVLMLRYKGAVDVLSAKNSPRMLTNIGQKVYNDMNGDKFLEAHKELLFSKIAQEQPKTAWDVENAALNACMSLVQDDVANDIKVFVYNYPVQQKEDGNTIEVSLQDALFVLSLPLRDKYLDNHPEISK